MDSDMDDPIFDDDSGGSDFAPAAPVGVDFNSSSLSKATSFSTRNNCLTTYGHPEIES